MTERWVDGDLEAGADDEPGPAEAGAPDLTGEPSTFEPEEDPAPDSDEN